MVIRGSYRKVKGEKVDYKITQWACLGSTGVKIVPEPEGIIDAPFACRKWSMNRRNAAASCGNSQRIALCEWLGLR